MTPNSNLPGLALLAAAALALISYSIWFAERAAPDVPDLMVLEVASFDDLPGWGEEDLLYFAHAFEGVCNRLSESVRESNHPNDVTVNEVTADSAPAIGGDFGLYGSALDWVSACGGYNFHSDIMLINVISLALAELSVLRGDSHRIFVERLRSSIEERFTPIRILNNSETTGLFTGYYEPELRGSRTQSAEFNTPLLSRPEDLVMVQLRDFPGDYNGRIAGRVIDGNLRPFESRAEIEAAGVNGAEPIVWIDDPVDAFFLHIQGSGRVVLDDGSVVRVGYAGQNGHPYTAIGRVLVQQGAMTVEEASMQSIRAWLAANRGDAAQEVLNANASYIFFTELDVPNPNLGPLGASGVQLTPEVSLAVDRRYHALGAPVYVSMETPDGETFNRLMVSQDTGGAIRGPIRGDVFWGFGEEAAAMAGRMRSQGEMWVLVPNAIAERIAAEQAQEQAETQD